MLIDSPPQYNTTAGQSIMVALLPTETSWCKIKLPHLTLVYAGEIPDRNFTDFNVLAKEAANIASLCSPIVAKVFGVETFGVEEKVNVLRVDLTPELKAMRQMLEMWNASEFTDYKPHCTIGPANEGYDPATLPMVLRFNQIMVGWGEQELPFWLKGGR